MNNTVNTTSYIPKFTVLRGQAGTSNLVNKMYSLCKQLFRIISYLQ